MSPFGAVAAPIPIRPTGMWWGRSMQVPGGALPPAPAVPVSGTPASSVGRQSGIGAPAAPRSIPAALPTGSARAGAAPSALPPDESQAPKPTPPRKRGRRGREGCRRRARGGQCSGHRRRHQGAYWALLFCCWLPVPMTDALSHVSDTARWVAVYRARETARPDALFRDPLAERFAGARGLGIAAATPKAAATAWSMVTRTKLIDDMVLAAVAEGCDRVLNLAAGLDTVPIGWRCRRRSPGSRSICRGDRRKPGCSPPSSRLRLVRESVDLADTAARRALLARAVPEGSRTLVITEGLVVYLEEGDMTALARDFAGRSGFAHGVAGHPVARDREDDPRGMGRHPARALIKWGRRRRRVSRRWARRARRAPGDPLGRPVPAGALVVLPLHGLFPTPTRAGSATPARSAVVRLDREG